MSDATTSSGRFACDACGKRYRWRSEWAGKRLKCKCGEIILCPAQAPADDLYELSAAPERVLAASPLATSSPASSPTLHYRRLEAQPATFNDYFPDKVKDL